MIRSLKSSRSFGLLIAILVTACATSPTDPMATTAQTESIAQTAQTESTAQTAQTESTTQTAQIKSAWKNSTHEGHPRKIMVIGVAKDLAKRTVFEDEFVRELKARGVDAIASYTLIPDAKQNDPVVIAEKISAQGSDAVLVTRLVSKKNAQIYVPGTIYHPHIYYDTWSDYFGYSYQALFMPDSIADDEYALMETNVYDALNRNMIWSATSETEMLSSDQKIIKSTVDATVSSMVGQKLLGK